MQNKIKVIIITLKKNNRINILKKRLKEINVNYKILKSIDGKLYKKNNKLDFIYDKQKTLGNIGRDLSDPEIGCAASHLKAYSYIIRSRIQQAIIMEDDAVPSKFLYQWIKSNIKVENNKILNFFCYPYGFIEKKSHKAFFNNSIKLHNVVGHTFGAACYQINNYTCKKIISLTQNKVTGYPDWPFSVTLHKINLSVTLPLLACVNDEGWSHLRKEREKKLKNNEFIKKILPSKIFNILRVLYYLSYFPYLTSKYPNKHFYYDYYVQIIITKFKNFFSNKYLQLEKIYYNKNYYFNDIKKIVKFLY